MSDFVLKILEAKVKGALNGAPLGLVDLEDLLEVVAEYRLIHHLVEDTIAYLGTNDGITERARRWTQLMQVLNEGRV